MKSSFLTKTLIVIMTIASFGQWNEVQAQSNRVVYNCIQHQGKAKTVADTSRGRIQLIVWESGYFSSSGWTPQKRCQEITRRFQKFSDNGTLQYVTTGVINNYPVICTGTRTTKGYQCRPDGLLITLQRNDNPPQVLRNLFSNATRQGGTPVTRSVGNNYVVPIQSVLDQAPRLEGTKPPTTQPPTTQSPTTQPPTTQPPITQPPTTQPPTTQPPTTQPPTTQLPTNQPPTTQPPTTQPPTTQPPTTQPPTTQLPTTQPPTTQLPTTQPPLTSSNPNLPQKSSTRNYQCIQHQGKPMTIVDTQRGRIQLILWESSYFSQSSWTPQKRCNEVTRRFQNFSDQGNLKYITTGKINQYNVICVSGQKPSPGSNISCSSEGLLITLEPTDDPDQVMTQLFQEAARIGSMPVTRSQRSQSILDMEQYLNKAPLMSQESVVIPETPVDEQPDVMNCPPILCD